jgi:hypothetical protein
MRKRVFMGKQRTDGKETRTLAAAPIAPSPIPPLKRLLTDNAGEAKDINQESIKSAASVEMQAIPTLPTSSVASTTQCHQADKSGLSTGSYLFVQYNQQNIVLDIIHKHERYAIR